jgi:hypothetical protein
MVSYPHEVLIVMAYGYFASGFVGELMNRTSKREPTEAAAAKSDHRRAKSEQRAKDAS